MPDGGGWGGGIGPRGHKGETGSEVFKMAFKRLNLKNRNAENISQKKKERKKKTAATLHFLLFFHQRFSRRLIKKAIEETGGGRTHAAGDGYGVGGAFLCGH